MLTYGQTVLLGDEDYCESRQRPASLWTGGAGAGSFDRDRALRCESFRRVAVSWQLGFVVDFAEIPETC